MPRTGVHPQGRLPFVSPDGANLCDAEAALTRGGVRWAEVEPSAFQGPVAWPSVVEVDAVEPQLIECPGPTGRAS